MESFIGFLSDTELAVPVGQNILFVLAITFCFLLKKYKLGLLITFCLVFFWGFIYNADHFINALGESSMGLTIYLYSGVGMALFVVVGFFRSDD